MEKNRIKQGFCRFCDGTSMHGFKDLYFEKTTLLKVLWIIVLFGTIGKCGYQIFGSFKQFMNQSTVTMIEPITKEELTYPPLKFCVAHWLQWIDWERAISLNFTKEAILFGMSYLTNVYSSDSFNVDKAFMNFMSTMALNNISTVESFYKTIAKRDLIASDRVEIELNDMEFVISDRNNMYFCYKVDGEKILKHFRKSKKQSSVDMEKGYLIKFAVFTNNIIIGTFVSREEYNSYMAEWIQDKTMEYIIKETNTINFAQVKNDYSNVQPPNILFVDGYGTTYINIIPEIDLYYISLKASAQRLKNKETMKCLEGVKSFASNSRCSRVCMAWAQYYCEYSSGSSFEFAIELNRSTKPEELHPKKIVFLNVSMGSEEMLIDSQNPEETSNEPRHNETGVLVDHNNVNNTWLPEIKYANQGGEEECDDILEMNNCMSEKCTLDGCEIWTYDVTVTTRSLHYSLSDVAYKHITSIFIKYPTSANVLIMIETDSKSWEDFIGNVGGILGIWTGASVISFFQLFYLCCFSNQKRSKEKENISGHNVEF